MKISKNVIMGFLVLFLVIILTNIITPFFGAWNFYLGIALVLFIVAAVWLYLRKSNPEAAKYTLLVTYGVLLAIMLVFVVLFTVSFLSNSTKTYSYDIGGMIDTNNSSLYPADRVSNSSIQNITHITYRNLTSFIVYFKAPAEYTEGKVNVSLSILENLPFGSMIYIRAKNSSTWTYVEELAYVSLGKTNTTTWKTVSVSFNTIELLAEDGQFNFAISSPHLLNAQTKRNYISLDAVSVSEFEN